MLALCWCQVAIRLGLGWCYVLSRMAIGWNAQATTTVTATAEEFSHNIQGPSSTHPGTTYHVLVRAIPHTDIYIYIYVIYIYIYMYIVY